jgi:hypothetical protein
MPYKKAVARRDGQSDGKARFFQNRGFARLRRLCRRAERHENHSLTARRGRDLLVIFEAADFVGSLGRRPG